MDEYLIHSQNDTFKNVFRNNFGKKLEIFFQKLLKKVNLRNI